MKLDNERNKSRLSDIEEWMVWWNRTVQPRDTQQDARLDVLEKQIYGSKP